MQYAARLADGQRADTVNIRAFGFDGAEVIATFLLDAGAPLMAETSSSTIAEPDNSDAIRYMQDKIDAMDLTQSGKRVDERESSVSYLEGQSAFSAHVDE